MQAGLGGGSADAAAVLRVLNKHYGHPLSMPALCELGSTIGSDVPFCVMQGTVLVEGVGNKLTKLSDAPEMYFAVCKPEFSVSTPGALPEARRDVHRKAAGPQGDDLESSEGRASRPLAAACATSLSRSSSRSTLISTTSGSMMITYGAYGAQVTGSGSAVFGIYDSFEYATVACTMLKDKYTQVFLAKNV